MSFMRFEPSRGYEMEIFICYCKRNVYKLSVNPNSDLDGDETSEILYHKGKEYECYYEHKKVFSFRKSMIESPLYMWVQLSRTSGCRFHTDKNIERLVNVRSFNQFFELGTLKEIRSKKLLKIKDW